MKLSLIGHNFNYELEKLIRIFLPFEKIEFSNDLELTDSSAITVLKKEDQKTQLVAKLSFSNKKIEFYDYVENSIVDYDKECERVLAVQLYKCFCKVFDYNAPWGILTGVRPAKLFSRFQKSKGASFAKDYFSNKLFVSEEKISLCAKATVGEEKITALSKPNSFSLYISIPFCPTRCSYCSFVSHSVDQAKKLIPRYVELLCEEITETANITKKLHLQLETVYIGGGTPTSLDHLTLEKIMNCVSKNLDLSNIREYTVEAGRPDTISKEKLSVIKNGGANRISINPQTMNDNVLQAIGRKHTAEMTLQAFNLARECGFDNINMDLIAGLPLDTFDSFKDTLNKVLNLSPESVTVHSLSIKRASTLNKTGDFDFIRDGITAGKMVDYAAKELKKHEILPYYMYRQSKTIGNLENVGYAKRGFESLYNVYIMDETHSIFACGASAVSKLRQPNGDYIERIFNFKYPYEYIDRFKEIIDRKQNIYLFYQKFPWDKGL